MKASSFCCPSFCAESYQIPPFLPKRGRIWHKIDIFTTHFCEDVLGPVAREPSQRARTQMASRPKNITRARHTHLPGGGRGISRTGRWLVTDMVKLRRLTKADNRNFPLWKSDFRGEPLLKTNGLLERVSVFGRFLTYQVLPNFTNFYQKRAANGLERAVKGWITGGFHERFY